MKTCYKCKKTKALSEFNKNKSCKDGLGSECKSCKKIYRKAHREQARVSARKWREAHPQGVYESRIQKRASRLKKYGLTAEQYTVLNTDQNGACAICGLPETARCNNGNIGPLSIDHCHSTGKVRGLLCSSCNTGLGRFKDDLDLLASAASYLINSGI